MKNGIYVLAIVAGAWILAMACPVAVKDRLANATQVPEHVQLEADRQVTMFVSWVRDDAGRPDGDAAQLDRH